MTSPTPPFPRDTSMRSGRLPWPTPDELDQGRCEVHDRITSGPRSTGPRDFALTDPEGRLHGPFNAMLINPHVGAALQEVGAAVRYRTSLDDRSRELAILTVAAAHRSQFEWHAHHRVAERLGVERRQFTAVLRGEPVGGKSDTEQIVVDTVRSLVRDHDLDNEAYVRAHDAVGLEGVQEIVALVGYYRLLATMLAVWRTPLPAGVESVFEGD